MHVQMALLLLSLFLARGANVGFAVILSQSTKENP